MSTGRKKYRQAVLAEVRTARYRQRIERNRTKYRRKAKHRKDTKND